MEWLIHTGGILCACIAGLLYIIVRQRKQPPESTTAEAAGDQSEEFGQVSVYNTAANSEYEFLYSEEQRPSFGTIADRRHGEDQVYEFGAAGDHYTLVAPSDKVAIMAITLITGGSNPFIIYYPGTSLQPPLMYNPTLEADFQNLYGHDKDMAQTIGKYMAVHYDAITEALGSVLIGGKLEREAFMESVEGLGLDPVAIEEFRKKWSDKRRTSAYDIAETARASGAALAGIKEQNIAPYREYLATLNRKP